MKIVSFNSTKNQEKLSVHKSQNYNKRFSKMLKKFENKAFDSGRSEDPVTRWKQIKKGLHAIRTEKSEDKMTKPEITRNYTPIQQAALEVAKHDLVEKLKTRNTSVSEVAADRSKKTEIDPLKHWLKIKSGMRAGQLEKVSIKNHTVRRNESLEDIARKFTGDAGNAGVIAKYNNMDANKELKQGTLLKIPTGGIMNRIKSFRG